MTPPTQTLRRYVQFFFPGLLMDESSTKEVQSRDLSAIRLPQGAFAFQFFDIIEMPAYGREDVMLRSEPLDRSKKYYVGGRVMTLREVRAEMPQHDILIRNMEGNGIARVIRTAQGSFQPFSEEEVEHLELV